MADAVDDDLSAIRLVVPGDDLDQGRLAGTILSEQRQHRTADGVEVHAMEDLDAAKGLANLAGLKPERLRPVVCHCKAG